MSVILSLDASSTTIGIAVLKISNGKISLIHSGFFKPPKKGDIFERLDRVRREIISLCNKFQPDEVVLEDIVLFMKGKSNAKTITLLATLNRTVGLAIFNAIGKSPNLLNVLKIRNAIKINNYPQKEEIPELVASHLKIDFPYLYNKKGKIAVESYDIADAIAAGLAFINNQPKKKKK